MKFFRWYASSGWRIALWSMAAAVIPAGILAGDMSFLYHLPEFLLGICIAVVMPGAVLFLILIGGPHGGGNKAINAIAGVVLFIVNAIFYRLIFGVIVKWRNKRKGVPKLF